MEQKSLVLERPKRQKQFDDIPQVGTGRPWLLVERSRAARRVQPANGEAARNSLCLR